MNFEDIDFVSSMSARDLLLLMKNLSSNRRKEVLSFSYIVDKLRNDLLRECNDGDVYRNFRELFSIIDVDDFFMIFDYDIIHEFYRVYTEDDFPNYRDELIKRNYALASSIEEKISKSKYRNLNEYKLFVCLMEKDKNINRAILYFLRDDNLFDELIRVSDSMYSIFANLDYDLLVKMVYKMEELNYSNGYQFVTSIDWEDQLRLIEENFNDNTLLRMLMYFNKNVISSFFESDGRALYLFRKFNVKSLAMDGIRFNREILLRDDFFDMLKCDNLVEFRKIINALEKNNDPVVIENKLNCYYDGLIGEFDSNIGIFKLYDSIIKNPELRFNQANGYIFDYDVGALFREYLDYDSDGIGFFRDSDKLLNKLRLITSRKISEIVVDALFGDNIFNVWLNIREMLRYNRNLSSDSKVIDDDRVSFYEKILDFDNISSLEKVSLFYRLRDKRINSLFYDDLRNMKDYAYDKIKDSMIDLSECDDRINYEYSKCYDTVVYDLREAKYTMMVRVLGCRYQKNSGNIRDCYSIISDENSCVYEHGNYDNVYGYSSFDSDRVIHMLEKDSFSSNTRGFDDVSKYVNRIMTAREITNGSSWYSEINIANLKSDGGKYETMVPDFVVAYDEISDMNVIESKRLGIPIVLIRKELLKDDDRVYTDFDSYVDMYNNDIDRNRIIR